MHDDSQPAASSPLEDIHYVKESRLLDFEIAAVPPLKTIIRRIEPKSLDPVRHVLNDLVDSFCGEYNRQLQVLKKREYRHLCIDFEGLREQLRQEFYDKNNLRPEPGKRVHKSKSPFGLLDKHWKCATQAATGRMYDYWCGAACDALAAVRVRPFFSKLTMAERAFVISLLLNVNERFFAFLNGKPVDVSNFKASDGSIVREPERLLNVVRSILFETAGRLPVHGPNRTCWFDEDSYKVVEKDGVQRLELTTKQRRKRVAVTLLGHGRISGTILLVRDYDGSFAVHVTKPLNPKPLREFLPDVVVDGITYVHVTGVDAGFSEVCVDDKGNHYGPGFFILTAKHSDQSTDTQRVRNRYYALIDKSKDDPGKCFRIRKNNLGKKQLRKENKRFEATVECLINRAVNQLLKESPSGTLILEALPAVFELPNISKRLNRLLTSWRRGRFKDRIIYMCAHRGVRVVFVQSAYSSQVCIVCGHVSRLNRRGNNFTCKACGHHDDADRKAAEALIRVLHDPRFQRYMTTDAVRAVYREIYLAYCAQEGVEPLPESLPPERRPEAKRTSGAASKTSGINEVENKA